MSASLLMFRYRASKVAVRYGAEPEEAEGDMVSGNFFSGLGVKMQRGRGFTEQDEKDHAPIAVISNDYWTRRFARDPDVLGTTLYVNGIGFTIVGIAARDLKAWKRASRQISGFHCRIVRNSMPGATRCKTERRTSPIRPGGVCG